MLAHGVILGIRRPEGSLGTRAPRLRIVMNRRVVMVAHLVHCNLSVFFRSSWFSSWQAKPFSGVLGRYLMLRVLAFFLCLVFNLFGSEQAPWFSARISGDTAGICEVRSASGPAHRAGLRPGDTLLSFDGIAIYETREADFLWRRFPTSATSVRVMFQRDAVVQECLLEDRLLRDAGWVLGDAPLFSQTLFEAAQADWANSLQRIPARVVLAAQGDVAVLRALAQSAWAVRRGQAPTGISASAPIIRKYHDFLRRYHLLGGHRQPVLHAEDLGLDSEGLAFCLCPPVKPRPALGENVTGDEILDAIIAARHLAPESRNAEAQSFVKSLSTGKPTRDISYAVLRNAFIAAFLLEEEQAPNFVTMMLRKSANNSVWRQEALTRVKDSKAPSVDFALAMLLAPLAQEYASDQAIGAMRTLGGRSPALAAFAFRRLKEISRTRSENARAILREFESTFQGQDWMVMDQPAFWADERTLVPVELLPAVARYDWSLQGGLPEQLYQQPMLAWRWVTSEGRWAVLQQQDSIRLAETWSEYGGIVSSDPYLNDPEEAALAAQKIIAHGGRFLSAEHLAMVPRCLARAGDFSQALAWAAWIASWSSDHGIAASELIAWREQKLAFEDHRSLLEKNITESSFISRHGGHEHGMQRLVNPHNQVIQEGSMDQGKRFGLWKTMKTNVELSQGRYLAGRKFDLWTQAEAEGERSEQVFSGQGSKTEEAIGRRRVYFAQGQLRAEGFFSQGRKEGLWRTWHLNGLLESEVLWRNDRQIGLEQRWDSQGLATDAGGPRSATLGAADF